VRTLTQTQAESLRAQTAGKPGHLGTRLNRSGNLSVHGSLVGEAAALVGESGRLESRHSGEVTRAHRHERALPGSRSSPMGQLAHIQEAEEGSLALRRHSARRSRAPRFVFTAAAAWLPAGGAHDQSTGQPRSRRLSTTRATDRAVKGSSTLSRSRMGGPGDQAALSAAAGKQAD
jgi:hypothetical protein